MFLRVTTGAAAGFTALAYVLRVLRRFRANTRAMINLAEEELDILQGNHCLLTVEELQIVKLLLDEGQKHLFQSWLRPGIKDRQKKKMLKQLILLDRSYPGGLLEYIRNARQLLTASAKGENAYDGWIPSVPQGVILHYAQQHFRRFEEIGLAESSNAAFVLVAGGIGERLGYSGIKVAIPTEMARGACFLELYIEHIRALEIYASRRADKNLKIPLAIMTSDDTHDATRKLLRQNNFFGLDSSQVYLMKQEKVPCLADNMASLATEANDPSRVQTKPHGHGDVHALLHSTGLARKWQLEGRRWICFFQDTNALAFRGLLPALGVSKEYKYDFNAVAIPRKAKDAIGAIADLKHSDGRKMTINVEYNQLEPLLKAAGHEMGDVNDSRTGFSPFPGNINQLVVSLPSYVQTLDRTKGIIGEFVNPKYADDTRTRFKKSTRLECMMQDYPKSLPANALVGFTQLDTWAAYSPVKNNPADAADKVKTGNPGYSATSGELDIYTFNCCALQMVGAKVETPVECEFNGLKLKLWPRVVLSPSFAPSFGELERKVHAREVQIEKDAVVVIDGCDIRIESLKVDGAFVLRAVPGAEVVISNLTVTNKGWVWQALEEGEEAPEHLKIRGFRIVKHETLHLEFKHPGKYVVSDEQPDIIEKHRVK
uniref:UTP-monosaccharide-1-phosphate uridylyltransferase n=1 Tax=Tetraselmis sp. GSL018 TaxID=582737 RepID=A0A061SAF4_9CHLO